MCGVDKYISTAVLSIILSYWIPLHWNKNMADPGSRYLSFTYIALLPCSTQSCPRVYYNLLGQHVNKGFNCILLHMTKKKSISLQFQHQINTQILTRCYFYPGVNANLSPPRFFISQLIFVHCFHQLKDPCCRCILQNGLDGEKKNVFNHGVKFCSINPK